MIKKKIFLILLFFFSGTFVFSNENVFISVYVDDKIITKKLCKAFLKDYKENDSDVSFALGRYLFNKESTIHKIKKIINNFVQI